MEWASGASIKLIKQKRLDEKKCTFREKMLVIFTAVGAYPAVTSLFILKKIVENRYFRKIQRVYLYLLFL